MPATTTTKRPRTAEHRARLRYELMESAIKLVVDGKNPSTTQISNAIGVTKGAIYWYWSCKERMYEDVMSHWLYLATTAIESPPCTIPTETFMQWCIDTIVPLYRELYTLRGMHTNEHEHVAELFHNNVLEKVLEPGFILLGDEVAADAHMFNIWLMGLASASQISYQNLRIFGNGATALQLFASQKKL